MPDPADLPARIHSAILAERDHFVAILRRLVCCESPTDDPDAFPTLFQLVTSELAACNFNCRTLPADEAPDILLAGRPASGSQQLIVGHLDTVWPRGTLAKMPFAIDNNIVRGPGVFDMKGGIAMLLTALKVLHQLDLHPTLAPVILLSTDEETGSERSRDTIERCARNAKRALVLEPALGLDGKLKSARKGIGRYQLTITGQAAHAGLDPESGASAILEMSHVVQTLFALNNPARGITVNVGTIDGGLSTNVIAAASSAKVEVRVRTPADADALHCAINAISAVNPKCRVTVTGAFDRPPMEPTTGNLALVERAITIASDLGFAVGHGAAGGASDGNFTSQYCPTLDGLGAVGDGAHADHEHLLLDQTLQRTALLANLLLEP